MATLYPFGYGRDLCTLDELVDRYGEPMHPEYRRRLFAYIEAAGGRIGIGSAWRPTPDPVSSASQQGHSFHQDQRWASGLVAIAAIDAVCPNGADVHRAPSWSEVPAQGSAEAAACGIHANVNGEPWHLQPVEVDGWQTWCDHGRPDPRPDYPLPTDPKDDDDMTDDQLRQITDRLDKLAADVHLIQVRSNTFVNSQVGKIAADVDRLADKVAGND